MNGLERCARTLVAHEQFMFLEGRFMTNELKNSNFAALQSIGAGTFGEGVGGSVVHRLFRVVPGHDLDFMLEPSSLLMGCVYKLTRDASLEPDDTLVLAAYT